ncbi:hypothetical protein FGU65_14975 [Methanoculleus sp. FWC-SCC1]|uniref:Uncharacterized protein n=1 Tax=Methanoculleus frigidifontis TaxID=2584085 RepID=A0ABT8ME01_9EURY|nr:hypothetical protein [Methanoculleus sp. FWC-SCC1]MDN7026164.1 hypothetical protein [Methanoculleus sp. FWC-SCC1]
MEWRRAMLPSPRHPGRQDDRRDAADDGEHCQEQHQAGGGERVLVRSRRCNPGTYPARTLRKAAG